MNLIFEQLQEKDISYIKDLGDEFADYSYENVAAFLSEKHNIALVAKFENKIIGLIYGYSLARMDGIAPQFFIYSIDIHPDYQDKGHGGQFMKYVIDWAKENGYSECFVLTNKDNPRACRVYEKAGMTHSESDCERMYEIFY